MEKPERSQIIARLASLPTLQSESSLSHLTPPGLDVVAAEVVGEGAAAWLARGNTGVTAGAGEGQDANRARGDAHGASSEAGGDSGGGGERSRASGGDDSLSGGGLRVITVISCGGVVVVTVVAVVTLAVALLLVALTGGSGHSGTALTYKLAFHDF